MTKQQTWEERFEKLSTTDWCGCDIDGNEVYLSDNNYVDDIKSFIQAELQRQREELSGKYRMAILGLITGIGFEFGLKPEVIKEFNKRADDIIKKVGE